MREHINNCIGKLLAQGPINDIDVRLGCRYLPQFQQYMNWNVY